MTKIVKPKEIITGENAVKRSMEYIQRMGKKCIIVTDDFMVKLGNTTKLTEELEKIGINYVVYSKINSEPTHQMIDEGVDLYKKEGCDFLIALGGGSPLDSMKAIGAVVTNGGRITEYMGKALKNETPPSVAIPTTAGTGSEATKVSIITNTETNVKMLLNDNKLMADLAVVDPIFTLTAPPKVTAATGVDALTHAIEAYTSIKANADTDVYAKKAVKSIYRNLSAAYKDGSNISARNEMATGALEAGIAFSNASVTIVHGMSRPIGALFHVPHGQSNAMLLRVCLDFIKPGVEKRLSDLAKEIGVYEEGMTEEEGAVVFVEAVTELLETLNVESIQDYGVAEKDFFKYIPKMAQDALDSGSPGNTVRTPNKEDIEKLYVELWLDGLRKQDKGIA